MARQQSHSERRAELLARCDETFRRYKELKHASDQLAIKALDGVQPDGLSGLKKSNELLRMAAQTLREHHVAVEEYLSFIKSVTTWNLPR
jgi:hypothetical protein